MTGIPSRSIATRRTTELAPIMDAIARNERRVDRLELRLRIELRVNEAFARHGTDYRQNVLRRKIMRGIIQELNAEASDG